MSDQSTKQVFVAATRQNDGKTMVSLGLFNAIRQRFDKSSYMKPVGQQYIVVDDQKVDKDAILFRSVYNLEDSLQDISPIAVPKGFTQEYIDRPEKDKNYSILKKAHKNLCLNRDFLLIEGTGHAGVGSVIDLSNAQVAKLFGSKVIIVSLGGIGRSIDEIMLNKAVFDLCGVEIMGVIINKIQEDKFEKISDYTKRGLEYHGIPVLGCIPFVNMLTKPSVETIFKKLGGELLSAKTGFNNRVERCMIGDMIPQDVLTSLEPGTLLIIPANREGLIMAALCGNLIDSEVVYYLSGIVFTGNTEPHEKILNLIKRTHIPLLSVKEDSFTIATIITNMLVKVSEKDSEKITKIQNLVEEYVDVDRICEEASSK